MTDMTIAAVAERLVREAAQTLSLPMTGECLQCYVARMLGEFRCNRTLRFAEAYRDRQAPRATALLERLATVGACCDCEMFLNAWLPHPSLWSPGREEVIDGITYRDEPEPPEVLPPCGGVRRGSTQPCDLWVERTSLVW